MVPSATVPATMTTLLEGEPRGVTATTTMHYDRPRGGRGGRRLDFNTKFALILSGVSLCGLLLLSTLSSNRNHSPAASIASSLPSSSSSQHHRWLEDDSGNNSNTNDYSSYSCSALDVITPTAGADQCNFAKTCNQGEGIWAPSVYCHYPYASSFVVALLWSPIVLLWMILLFRMLGSTAEDYFSPALEMMSHKLGLPPRFAGVSLLALGNGAADVSATVSAIASDPVHGYKLSLGALSGAAMVISGVIAAVVILTAGGVPCRGALVRDVTALAVACGTVWWQLGSGSVGSQSVALFLSLYGVFVVLVLVADVYHRAVVVPRNVARAGHVELERQLEAAHHISTVNIVNSAGGTGGDDDGSGDGMGGVGGSGSGDRMDHDPTAAAPPRRQKTRARIDHMLTALSNYDNVNPNDTTNNNDDGVESDDLAMDRPIQLRGNHGILNRHPTTAATGTDAGGASLSRPASVDQEPSNVYVPLEEGRSSSFGADLVDHACVGLRGIPADSWGEAIEDGRDEVLHHFATLWNNAAHDPDLHYISKFLLVCELPFTILRQVTVPIPCEGYYNRAMVAIALVLSPLWFVYYMWIGHDVNWMAAGGWMYIVLGESLIVLGALALLRYAPGGDGELRLSLATPIALYGFVIAATWIDTIADSLVSLLNFVGLLLRIPGPVLGLTILAWGNSMGDLSANITMARKGLANMAMTACFAGPLFNMLVGLGLGFASLAASTGQTDFAVELSPSVVTGFVFIILNCLAMVGTGLGRGTGRIPKQYGYLALSVYTVYLVTSISLQYSKYGDNDDEEDVNE